MRIIIAAIVLCLTCGLAYADCGCGNQACNCPGPSAAAFTAAPMPVSTVQVPIVRSVPTVVGVADVPVRVRYVRPRYVRVRVR